MRLLPGYRPLLQHEAPEILNYSKDHQRRKAWELPISFLSPISKRCQENSILFSCTPFYLDAVKELLPYVDFYKIASYELLWHKLLIECAQTGKPIVLSTGMADLNEINDAVRVLTDSGCTDLTLLHCISEYPSRANHCNLSALETLRTEFKHPVGWSDHSIDPAVIFRAVHKWDAALIEFHLDLDGKGDEYASGHCWLPDKIETVIQTCKRGLLADGNGIKAPIGREHYERIRRADPIDGLRPLISTRLALNRERKSQQSTGD